MDMTAKQHIPAETDRVLVAHALTIAGELEPGREPSDTARMVIVELCKRVHLKNMDARMREASARSVREVDEHYSLLHVALAVIIGMTVGVGTAALLFATSANGAGFA